MAAGVKEEGRRDRGSREDFGGSGNALNDTIMTTHVIIRVQSHSVRSNSNVSYGLG